jgi:hypothetical protein
MPIRIGFQVTADPVLDPLLELILDPGLLLEALCSLTSFARSAFFNSIAYSAASFKPMSLHNFTWKTVFKQSFFLLLFNAKHFERLKIYFSTETCILNNILL